MQNFDYILLDYCLITFVSQFISLKSIINSVFYKNISTAKNELIYTVDCYV